MSSAAGSSQQEVRLSSIYINRFCDTHPCCRSPSQNNTKHVDDIPRTPRRTPMACLFCRGRKLKCDGGRPSCSNCNRRGYPCSYIPV
ncbi:hypothetical protein AMATHDRAFT_145723 [Amanita thiersii Skay4041]|uniref:Zn(2)-C6 fungal-type domain-containing protein n=1 Tax=Amanita thiersii Skay4041 TaxID=703135 RepID=A0A2A9NJF2_9AGAR|nr:hypothetical protein AMATHDRAFT_145723 [Amanita thiersii Skay4041]